MKTKKMVIRDSMAPLNGDKTTFSFKDGIHIVGEDERSLFDIYLTNDNQLEISVHGYCKPNKRVLEDRIKIIPRSVTTIILERCVEDE